MKKKEKYVCEVCEGEFDSMVEAEKCQEMCEDLKKNPFLNIEDSGCEFANGHGYLQLEKKQYDEMTLWLTEKIKKYNKWAYDDWKKNNPKYDFRECLWGGFIGRYLGDGDSKLYKYWSKLYCICPKCYKQYGQPYYAINCCKKESE